MTGQRWTEKEIKTAMDMQGQGASIHEISNAINRSWSAVHIFLGRKKREGVLPVSKLPPSKMPLWDAPLKSEGDALILTDVEAPFQHSEFINRCLDLADAWGVKTLHLGGDLLHYDNLSAWGSSWVQDKEEIYSSFIEVMEEVLRDKDKAKMLEVLHDKGIVTDGSLSGELTESRAVFRSFASFKEILVDLGNHDDRYLRALQNAVGVNELLHQIDRHHDKRWKIAPYYYSLIETEAGTYRVEHPRGAGKNTAIDLAIQFHSHIVMGHSHRWAVNRDPSGRYWAIQTGCCVDERRLAYVQQRSAKRDAHVLGATIIRDGYPFVLSPETPWDLMRRM